MIRGIAMQNKYRTWRIPESEFGLSYRRSDVLVGGMACPNPDRDDEEPEWKRIGMAVEFWTLTAIVGGALVYGIVLTFVSLAAE